jgi:hypothetical protein
VALAGVVGWAAGVSFDDSAGFASVCFGAVSVAMLGSSGLGCVIALAA